MRDIRTLKDLGDLYRAEGQLRALFGCSAEFAETYAEHTNEIAQALRSALNVETEQQQTEVSLEDEIPDIAKDKVTELQQWLAKQHDAFQ